RSGHQAVTCVGMDPQECIPWLSHSPGALQAVGSRPWGPAPACGSVRSRGGTLKIRRTTMAIVAAGALVLSACTSGTEEEDPTQDEGSSAEEGSEDDGGESAAPGDDSEATSDGGEEAGGETPDTAKPDLGDITTKQDEISYSVGADEWAGYNSVTTETNSVYNSVISSRLQSSFWYYGTDGTIYPDEDFGTYETVSEDPLTVEYTISDEAVWEDGTPITYNDFLFDWASNNPPSLFGEPPAEDDPAYEDYVPAFNSVAADWGIYVPEGPEGEFNSKTFTVTYPEPYPDYELLVGGALPSHVAAEQSGMTPEELVTAIKEKEVDKVKKAAEFWNEGWLAKDRTLPD